MAAPTAPTASNIVTEAFKKTGIGDPTATQITRATDYFLEEVKDDIYNRAEQDGHVQMKTLQSWDVQSTTIGISKYAVPSDFDSEMTLTFLNGTHTGTATAGAAKTVTLAADEDAAVAAVEGKFILITGGTGENEFRQVTDYNSTTMVATVLTAWGTNPDNTSTYRIIDHTTELDEENIEAFGGVGSIFDKGTPSGFCKFSEDGSEYLMLDKPSDASTYGLLLRYYLNIHKIDLSSDHYTKLLTNWRTVLTYGVAAKVAENEDDDKFAAATQRYEAALKTLFIKELPYGGEFQGFSI